MIDLQPPHGFAPGDQVRVVYGPFSDFMGTVHRVDWDKWNAEVALQFLGRVALAKLSLLDLRREDQILQ
jgi:transcription termination/antitermination protein NusG